MRQHASRRGRDHISWLRHLVYHRGIRVLRRRRRCLLRRRLLRRNGQSHRVPELIHRKGGGGAWNGHIGHRLGIIELGLSKLPISRRRRRRLWRRQFIPGILRRGDDRRRTGGGIGLRFGGEVRDFPTLLVSSQMGVEKIARRRILVSMEFLQHILGKAVAFFLTCA